MPLDEEKRRARVEGLEDYDDDFGWGPTTEEHLTTSAGRIRPLRDPFTWKCYLQHRSREPKTPCELAWRNSRVRSRVHRELRHPCPWESVSFSVIMPDGTRRTAEFFVKEVYVADHGVWVRVAFDAVHYTVYTGFEVEQDGGTCSR